MSQGHVGEESSADLAPGAEPPIRYIKLGRGGAWAERAIEAGEIPLGYGQVPHEIALQGDRSAVLACFTAAGRSPGKAASFAREVMDFYELGPETIWITFAGGHLWWARARSEVVPVDAPDEEPKRFRRTIDGWHNTDARGRALREDSLSTRLTKVSSYQQTICRIDAADYLRRKLAGQEEPIVAAATTARNALLSCAEDLISALHWADFETLVDLMLARGGWHRVSALGGTMKDADLIVEQPVTGETALVQVKSSASQATLQDYVQRFDAAGSWSRLLFVCHSPRGELDAGGRPDIIVWARRGLAEAAIRNGLFDWLLERAA